MDNSIIIFLIAIIVVLFILSIPSQCNPNNSTTEGFYTYQGYYKKYCPSCGWRSRYSCSNCTNCGWSIDDSGNGTCLPGTSEGPLYNDKTKYYEYSDPYYYYPYSNIYPIVKLRSSYPYYNWQIPNVWKEEQE